MPDPAGRVSGAPAAQPAAEENEDSRENNGWGSPVPAEYGSLRASRPPRPTARAKQSNAGSAVSALLKRIQGADVLGRVTRTGSREAARPPLPTANGVAHRAADSRTRTPSPAGAPPGPATIGPSRTTTPASQPGPVAPPTSRASAPASRRPLPEPRLTRRERRDAATVRAQKSRSRVVVRHLDIWTVVRVSVVFYVIAAIVIVAASLLLWYAADAFGTLPSIEKSIRTLFGLKSFHIHAGAVAGYMTLAGIVIAVAGAIFNVLAALVYNLISDVVGGVRVELELPRPRRQPDESR